MKALQDSLSHPRSQFFVTMAILLMAVVFLGFARTFYLKVFFPTPELPWYLHSHGAVLTAWYSLFLAQTMLVTTNRVATHRRLGVLAAVAAPFLIVTTIFVILSADVSTGARGIVRTEPIEQIVLGDLSMLAAFSILVLVAVSLRHRPAVHKRAMLLANIALVIPALPRIARLPLFADAGPVGVTLRSSCR